MNLVKKVYHSKPAGNLPRWVREIAEQRGFGDATQPVSLVVTEDDINEAFACAAQGNGAACVMAQAGTRLGCKSVYFFRGGAWVDFGVGPLVKFKTTYSIYNNIIDPFDRGARDEVTPGVYHLMPPSPSNTIEARRVSERKNRKPWKKSKQDGSKSMVHSHFERVVMAKEATSESNPKKKGK